MRNSILKIVMLCLVIAFNSCRFPYQRVKQNDKSVTINGVKWAACNVDAPGTFAANPEDAGMFYQWNRKVPWSSTGDISDWDA
ncbi:MAG: hypothetical protein LBK94_00690, partial [Prevotellaceae bacterium]|nr:hypothetical protein [Prevotellaceae bacterium]